MFSSPEDLCDVVSILPYRRDDNHFYLLNDEIRGGLWIPSRRCQSNNQWRCVAQELLDEYFTSGELRNVCKLVRVWKPPEKGEIHHVVFTAQVAIDSEEKETPNDNVNVVWMLPEEAKKNYNRLRSQELLDYISVVKNEAYQVPDKQGHIINTHKRWSALIGENALNVVVEILEKHVFPDLKQSVDQKLLDSAHFTRRVQIGLFAHFLVRCFPCTYMNQTTFTKVVRELFGDENLAPRMFRTADVNSRGFLSYRDFLYFMAVVEPQTDHRDQVGELRSRYIFRHYDQNNDLVLDQEEMRTLVQELKDKWKSRSACFSDVCSLTSPGGSDFALNITTYLEMVSGFKLRGTSLLLRSEKSSVEIFPPLSEDIKFVKFPPEPATITGALATRTVTFFPCSSDTSQTSSDDRLEPRRNFDVEIHSVQLTETGTVVDIENVENDSAHSLGSQYDALFDQVYKNMYMHAQSNLLKYMKFFTRGLSSTESFGPKRPFSWGTADPSSMVTSLLRVSEAVTVVLKEEPRLVEISPPVCAVGDLHGNFSDLLLLERAFWNLGPALSPTTLLFLGDYVDKGPHGVEVISYLFAHKLGCPKKIVLLRGIQEIRMVQQSFFSECVDKFGDTLGRQVWGSVNAALDCLPLAAVVGGRVFCCHGGIPPPWLCPVAAAINSVPCPLPQPHEQSPLAWELLWNEPLRNCHLAAGVGGADSGGEDVEGRGLQAELEAKEGFAANPSPRGTGHLFSARALRRFLLDNGLSLLVRARENLGDDEDIPEALKKLMLTPGPASRASTQQSSRTNHQPTCVLVYAVNDRKE